MATLATLESNVEKAVQRRQAAQEALGKASDELNAAHQAMLEAETALGDYVAAYPEEVE